MQTILVLGAGLSSGSLIQYFLDQSDRGWKVRVGDINPEFAHNRIKGHPSGEAFLFDVFNLEQRDREISGADIVISLLPARMHYLVAEACVELGKNMVTASYLSAAVKALDETARKKGVVLMNECGVDPGIDHMSAMKMIDRIKNEGGQLKAFESSTGGLVAPGFENNPWQYKFTWNPRNVVLAGGEGARFLYNGKFKYIPHHKVFRRIETIKVPDLGVFESKGNYGHLEGVILGIHNSQAHSVYRYRSFFNSDMLFTGGFIFKGKVPATIRFSNILTGSGQVNVALDHMTVQP